MRDHAKDTVTITSSDYDDIIIDTNYTFDLSSSTTTIDISSITTSTLNYDDLFSSADDFTITLNDPVEFEDHMPDVAKVEDMCNDYPALRKAYENFKTIYKMVHQDWQGRQDAEDQFPF